MGLSYVSAHLASAPTDEPPLPAKALGDGKNAMPILIEPRSVRNAKTPQMSDIFRRLDVAYVVLSSAFTSPMTQSSRFDTPRRQASLETCPQYHHDGWFDGVFFGLAMFPRRCPKALVFLGLWLKLDFVKKNTNCLAGSIDTAGSGLVNCPLYGTHYGFVSVFTLQLNSGLKGRFFPRAKFLARGPRLDPSPQPVIGRRGRNGWVSGE
jgi:hypothetical protein